MANDMDFLDNLTPEDTAEEAPTRDYTIRPDLLCRTQDKRPPFFTAAEINTAVGSKLSAAWRAPAGHLLATCR